MRYIPLTSSAIHVTVGPFVQTDGVTTVTAATGASVTCYLVHDHDDATAATSASYSLDGKLTHLNDGLYDVTLDAATIAFLGRMKLTFKDVDVMMTTFEDFMILPEANYKSLVLGTDNLEVDVIAIRASTSAATNISHFALNCYTSEAAQVSANFAGSMPANFSTMAIATDGGVTIRFISDPTAPSTTLFNPMLASDVNVEVADAITDAGLAVAASLAAIDIKIDTIDTNVDSILEDTGTTLNALLTDIQGSGFVSADDSLVALGAGTLNIDLTSVLNELTDIKGTGFVKDTNSLVNVPTSNSSTGSVIGD